MTFTEMLSGAVATVIAFLPNLLAALLILAIGLFVAALLGRLTRRLLESVDLPRRQKMRQLVSDEAVLQHVPHTAGRIVYWALALIVIGLAIDALQLTWLSAGLARVLAYVPNVLAAAAILFGAYLLGNYVHRKTSRRDLEAGESSSEQPANPRILPSLLRAGIYVIAGFMALQELGIATTIVTSAFIISLGAISIAAAVAFGLGNRELAGRVTRDWYDRRRSERGRTRVFASDEGPSPLPSH